MLSKIPLYLDQLAEKNITGKFLVDTYSDIAERVVTDFRLKSQNEDEDLSYSLHLKTSTCRKLGAMKY